MQCNRLTCIENIQNLKELTELYLSENAITKIDNLDENEKLETLDLAQNKIKKIENIEQLEQLSEFWVNIALQFISYLKIKFVTFR